MSGVPGVFHDAPRRFVTPADVYVQAVDQLRSAMYRARIERRVPTSLVGFDGFIDSIVKLVATRHAMTHDAYTPVPTIRAFADRVALAAGKSTNIEQVLLEDRFGGNGPLMAGALTALGSPTTFIGAIADERDASRVHPTFAKFAVSCARAIALCPPSRTLCAEFDDGKVMFNECASVQRVTWDLVRDVVGLDALRGLVAQSSVLAMVNWSLLGGVEGIWEGLLRDVLPMTERAPGHRRIFLDLSDPAKRTDEDIARCAGLIQRLDALRPVTLGLNLAEAQRVWSVLAKQGVCSGAHTPERCEQGTLAATPATSSNSLDAPTPETQHAFAREEATRLAACIRDALDVACVVVHPREGAAAATRAASPQSSAVCWCDGPLCSAPKLSTGAGDHLNAGFAIAQALSLPTQLCLAVATCVSGAYVRDAMSPDIARTTDLLQRMARG